MKEQLLYVYPAFMGQTAINNSCLITNSREHFPDVKIVAALIVDIGPKGITLTNALKQPFSIGGLEEHKLVDFIMTCTKQRKFKTKTLLACYEVPSQSDPDQDYRRFYQFPTVETPKKGKRLVDCLI